MTQEEINDWYENSTCVACGQPECFGDCPEYIEWEKNMIGVEDNSPVIPCKPEEIDVENKRTIER